MDYDVVNIPNDRYDLRGMRLANGKACCYWTNRGSGNINGVTAILNNSNVVAINNNEICISLDGIDSVDDICDMLSAFSRELYKYGTSIKGVNFRFVVSNQEEEMLVNKVNERLRLSAVVKRGLNYGNVRKRSLVGTDQRQSELKRQRELKEHEELKREEEERKRQEELRKREEFLEKNKDVKDLSAGGRTDNVTTYNNGIMEKYSVSDGKIYRDNDFLSINEQKQMLLDKLIKDPVEYEKISNMRQEELDVYLNEIINSNKKAYYLESASKQSVLDERGAIANEAASREDGKVNTELGISTKLPSSSDKYQAVETREDGTLEMVTPEVTTSTVGFASGTQGTSSFDVGDSVSDDMGENYSNEESLSERKVENIYYFDDYNNIIYNSLGEAIGKVGAFGYEIDIDTNELKKDGQVLGSIGDINDMGKDNNNSKNKTNVYKRVYKKDNIHSIYGNNRSDAFVSLPVIIFIISLLLLIGSGIILFMMR